MRIASILEHPDISTLTQGRLSIQGWIQQFRKQSDICFFQVSDGSHAKGLQVICDRSNAPSLFDQLDTVNVGCYVQCEGNLVDSPAKGQSYELQLLSLPYSTSCDISSYPLKKSLKLPQLRQMAHMRAKTKAFGCIYRIRNTCMFHSHEFFQKKGFLHIDPNIITVNECEGGAGAFQVTELLSHGDRVRDIPTDKKGNVRYAKDHFKKKAYLTVSSQLQLEAIACGMGHCYTTNKSFRAEHSMTNKHVSEFTHLEIEMTNISNDDLMDIGSQYIKSLIHTVYHKHKTDLEELNKFIAKGILDTYRELMELTFHKVSYDDCIRAIQEHSSIECTYGEDLSSEMEHFITDHYKGAVFVYDWPLSIKSFYMRKKRVGDARSSMIHDTLCENFDLLMPYGVGELIGGSMREERLDLLEETMENKDVSADTLQWYLDLRRFGTVPHGGFGLGLDRLIALLTGMKNIKDVIPFPVHYQNCDY